MVFFSSKIVPILKCTVYSRLTYIKCINLPAVMLWNPFFFSNYISFVFQNVYVCYSWCYKKKKCTGVHDLHFHTQMRGHLLELLTSKIVKYYALQPNGLTPYLYLTTSLSYPLPSSQKIIVPNHNRGKGSKLFGMHLFFVSSTFLWSVCVGQPEIGSLLVKNAPKFGDSDRICSALVPGERFRHFFPVFNGFNTDINRLNARKTVANMYGTITELDREFPEEVKRTIHVELKMYNALARNGLSLGWVMEKMKIDRETFSVFGFLDVSDLSVKTDFDNAILYAYAKYGKFSLGERISRFEYDALLNTESNVDTISRLGVLNNDLKHLSNAFGQRYRLGWFDVFEFCKSAAKRRIDFQNPELTFKMNSYHGRLMNGMKCKIWVSRVN